MTKKRKLRARVREVMLAEGKNHTAALAQVRRGAKQAPQASSPRGGSETQLAEQTPLGENFAGQSLLAVSFNDRDLRYADFSGANISHADFSGADLTGANFRGAVALRAKFCKVKCFAWGELDFARPELLSRVEAAPTHFCNANLEGADFSDADLQRADLSGANLRCASLARSSLHQSKCREANFEHADFAGAYLNQTDFVGANLANSKLMVGGYKTDFSNTNLKGALLYNAGIKQGTFRRADLSNADLREPASIFWTPPVRQYASRNDEQKATRQASPVHAGVQGGGCPALPTAWKNPERCGQRTWSDSKRGHELGAPVGRRRARWQLRRIDDRGAGRALGVAA